MSVATQLDRWEQWRVVHYVDDYILRYALHAAVFVLEAEERRGAFGGGPVTDAILVLLRLSIQISAKKACKMRNG